MWLAGIKLTTFAVVYDVPSIVEGLRPEETISESFFHQCPTRGVVATVARMNVLQDTSAFFLRDASLGKLSDAVSVQLSIDHRVRLRFADNLLSLYLIIWQLLLLQIS